MATPPHYTDDLLNALMFSHQPTLRAELWYAGAKVENLNIANGTVSADRGSVVRRTADLTIDPGQAPQSLTDRMGPYGSIVKIWRGVRFPDNSVLDRQIFWGRIDSVDYAENALTVRCSDLAAFVTDARFEAPVTKAKGTNRFTAIRDLIQDAIPGITVTDNSGKVQTLAADKVEDRDRTAMLNSLANDMGCDWYATPDGVFVVAPFPSLTSTNNPAGASWIINTGDQGVLVSRHTTLERTGIYNAMVVNSEPPDNTAPIRSVARDNNPNSPTKWGGPFGKVPKFYTSAYIKTQADADSNAVSMLAQALSATNALDVQCVPNPRLMLGDLVWVESGRSMFTGMYFVQSFTMPLAAGDGAMSLVVQQALSTSDSADVDATLLPAPFSAEEHVLWRP